MTAVGDRAAGTGRPAQTFEVVVTALVRDLIAAGETVATGESLTGGLVVASLVDVPGASAIVRGGVVAYHSDVKASVLGVDLRLLARGGAVQAVVAAQLAQGAQARFGATWGIGTTGVAGPDPSDGQPVGTVFIGVAGPSGTVTRALTLAGTRTAIRRGAVRAALELLRTERATGPSSGASPAPPPPRAPAASGAPLPPANPAPDGRALSTTGAPQLADARYPGVPRDRGEAEIPGRVSTNAPDASHHHRHTTQPAPTVSPGVRRDPQHREGYT